MHRDQVDVRTVLVVPAAIVVECGELSSLGGGATDPGTTCGVLVDVVSEVDDIVGIVVDDRARVGREEAAKESARSRQQGKGLLGVVGARVDGEALGGDVGGGLSRSGTGSAHGRLVVRLGAVGELVGVPLASGQTVGLDLLHQL